MTIPEFNTYGLLGYLSFKLKQDRFQYIKIPETKTTSELTRIANEHLTDMFNSSTSELITILQDQQILQLKQHAQRVELHPLSNLSLESPISLALDDFAELVVTETSSIFLPTVKTTKLLAELLRRINPFRKDI